jgi:hypothetical protein
VGQIEKTTPQGLKPLGISQSFGTAEAVPLTKPIKLTHYLIFVSVDMAKVVLHSSAVA